MANQLLETKHFFIFIFCGSSKICDKETFIYNTATYKNLAEHNRHLLYLFVSYANYQVPIVSKTI